VFFTSDNGPVVDDGYRDDAVIKLGAHRPAGPLRGGKYSRFEGGTRVPFIVRWPGRVKPSVSHALVSQVDFVASFGAWRGQPVGPDASDSENTMAAFLGESDTGRTLLVEQADGLSLREGAWKYIEPGEGPAIDRNTKTELGASSEPQLYDLASDLGEARNVAPKHRDRLERMRTLLDGIRRKGRRQPD
jgi:arylsulfatase A-like enzyme